MTYTGNARHPNLNSPIRVILQILNNPYSIFVACRVLGKGRQIHGFPPLIESVGEGVDGVCGGCCK